MVKKFISGGHLGADQTGIEEAAKRGFETGGTMPYGWRTDKGPMYEWAKKYGLKQHTSSKYPPRTKQNVKDADCTVWFGNESAGKRCTRTAAQELGKGHLFFPNPTQEAFLGICKTHKVINIAGNRNTINPEVDELVRTAFAALD